MGRKRITAKQFYKIIKDKSKYKLINGLFIVKYKGNGIYQYWGDFYRKGGYGAKEKTSYVEIKPTNQLFYPRKNLTKTNLGLWKPLRIKFEIEPISAILK